MPGFYFGCCLRQKRLEFLCWCTISLLSERWDLLAVTLFWLKNHLNTLKCGLISQRQSNFSFGIWPSLAVADCSLCSHIGRYVRKDPLENIRSSEQSHSRCLASFTSRLLTFLHRLAGVNTDWAAFLGFVASPHLSEKRRRSINHYRAGRSCWWLQFNSEKGEICWWRTTHPTHEKAALFSKQAGE